MPGRAQAPGLDNLATLTPGRTRAENALWVENPLTAQFKTSKRVVVAALQGPGVITMMHFAYPESAVSKANQRLNRDLLLRIYWDGETSPSVDCPLVDFFCDPDGVLHRVDTALANVRRGFNEYFPMPFRRSARVELVYQGPLEPGKELWSRMPCYSYVMYRRVRRIGRNTGYFHASWRQKALLLGKGDYVALDAAGRGKFVGWNVTVRLPGRNQYPVDENEKFYIDGETNASIEFQGLEDSFGFSWGFPKTQNEFPFTGYFPFLKGAFAYRFFVQDAISFDKSLRVAIGFGANEGARWYRDFSRPGMTLQFSSTVYWYQTEPHRPFPPMPSAADRAPAPDVLFWPDKEQLPDAKQLERQGVDLLMLCGRPDKELFFARPGYSASVLQGSSYAGWPPPVYYARFDNQELRIELRVPPGAKGKVRLFIADPDTFQGGRREKLIVAGDSLGTFEHFGEGRWIEHSLSPEQTATGQVLIQAINQNKAANAVISKVEWVGAGP
jgi:D-arabinan exo alpha-(1,3)/(1,5)-arabinofuranosidase (non-reducing end)